MSSTGDSGPPDAGGGPPGGPPALPPNAYDSMQPMIIGVCAFLVVWSTVMITARIYTRKFIIDSMGWDDFACIVGYALTMSEAITVTHMTKYNLGRHIYLIQPFQIPLYFRDFYLSIVLYCAALLFLKLTFLLQYYRVLAVGLKMRIIYLVALFIVGGWALSQTMVGIFACTPVAAFWDKSIPNAKCMPNLPQFYINAAGNIATDIAVFALPLPAIWKLNLVRGQKLMLIGIFSLGFFTVIISIVRIRFLEQFEDFTWKNSEAALWSTGELVSALTCACLPTLKPFVTKFFPGLGQVLGRTTAPSGGSAKPGGVSSNGGGKWMSGKFSRSGAEKSGALSLHSRTEGDEEGKGSEVELANAEKEKLKGMVDARVVKCGVVDRRVKTLWR
ncbi:hypothetical protein QBC39DRAFT_424720 [Podospora conica]|nr:hypothetical protein QBC39DRAFT_424720 [Schizothecium conicum]